MAALGIDENNIIGEIVSHQQLIGGSAARDHRQPRGIGNSSTVSSFASALRDSFSRGDFLHRNFDEAFWINFSFVELVDCNPVPSVILLFAGGISDRSDRGVQMIAICAERQPDEIALVSLFGEAIVR